MLPGDYNPLRAQTMLVLFLSVSLVPGSELHTEQGLTKHLLKKESKKERERERRKERRKGKKERKKEERIDSLREIYPFLSESPTYLSISGPSRKLRNIFF